MQEAEETGLQSNTLPELPLPAIDSNATKVLLGARPQPPHGRHITVLSETLSIDELMMLKLLGSKGLEVELKSWCVIPI